MLRYAALIFTVVAASNGAKAEGDPASPAWNEKRAALAQNLCVSTAPSFGLFEDAARSSGFVDDGNFWSNPNHEFVASLAETPAGCRCLFSFGSDAPDDAATAFGTMIVRDPRVSPTAQQDTFAKVSDPKAEAIISVTRTVIQGGTWIGVAVVSPFICPRRS